MLSQNEGQRAERHSTTFVRLDGYTLTTALVAFSLLSVLAFVLVAYFFLPS